MPANAPYVYTAGPEGIEILEFRGVGAFDMRITEGLDRWDRILDVVRANRDRWTTYVLPLVGQSPTRDDG